MNISIPEIARIVRSVFQFRKDQFYIRATGANQLSVEIRDKSLGVTPRFFQLIDFSTTIASVFTPRIQVTTSLLGDAVPDFPNAEAPFSIGDIPPCYFLPLTATGVLFAHIELDTDGGDVTSDIITREFDFAETIPDNTDTDFYFPVGAWSITDDVLTVGNYIYGPIEIVICRNWFSSPITQGVTFTGSPA